MLIRKKNDLLRLWIVALLVTFTTSALASVSLGKVSGYKFNDLNGNGIDDNEPRISGVLITLKSIPSGIEDSVETDDQGKFLFKKLPNGKYKICETLPEATPPWTPTTPKCVKVVLKGKAPHMKVRFGNKQVEAPKGSISGKKFNDFNRNGSMDDGEMGLSGWTITITGITNPSFEDSAVTGNDGSFSFTNLPLGQYQICETPQVGWTNTTPTCVIKELTAQVLSLTALFGNRQVETPRGSLSGMKFNDLNGNGTLDQGEVGLGGWIITLNGITDPTFEDSTVTGNSGAYSFIDLPLGTYEICEVAQSGWLNTTPICVTKELTAQALTFNILFGNKVKPAENPGCTFTQGYWKNKAGKALMTQLIPVGGLLLGTTAYSVNQLQAILDTPVQGNGLLNLAHQLIAAKFNLLNGASGTALGTSIATADTLIGSLVVGVDVVTNGSNPALYAQMIAVKDTLASFNEGQIGPGHCN